MNLTGIISISGKPGLYKVIAQSKNSIIVESLDTNKRVPAYATDRISAIEDISIYTYEEEVPLKTIFAAIFEKEGGKNVATPKDDAKKLEKYLSEILPNYDKERVYASDIRKIFQWYNKLNDNGLIVIEEEKTAEKQEVAETKASKTTKEAKEKVPAKKEAPKVEKTPKEAKEKAPKAEKVVKEAKEKAPAKKATATKKEK